YMSLYFFCFFFQAEDGIRDFHVTGVQTCALPIFIWSCGVVPTIGAPPARPVVRISRLAPLPSRTTPITTRVRLRSSSNATPAANSTPISSTYQRLGLTPAPSPASEPGSAAPPPAGGPPPRRDYAGCPGPDRSRSGTPRCQRTPR